jgi:hypothetical protein
MRRISQDYVYQGAKPAPCKMCGRQVWPGMFAFSVRLQSGREGVCHSLCEREHIKKLY